MVGVCGVLQFGDIDADVRACGFRLYVLERWHGKGKAT